MNSFSSSPKYSNSEFDKLSSFLKVNNDHDDICRGQETKEPDGQMSSTFEEDVDYENGYISDNNDDDSNAPKMPDEFYDNLDGFLKKPPPKLSKSDNIQIKLPISITDDKVTLPKIPPSVMKPPMPQRPPIAKLSKATSKIREIINGRANEIIVKPIDENLLREAFAYSDQINREAALEEAMSNASLARGHLINDNDYDIDNEDNNNIHMNIIMPRSAPPHAVKKTTTMKSTQKNNNGNKKCTSSTSSVSVVKKIRGQTHNVYISSTSSKGGEFEVAGNTLEEDSFKKNAIDYDALVANFEQGILLQRLRAELEASKQSVSKTTEYMRKLTQDALNGR